MVNIKVESKDRRLRLSNVKNFNTQELKNSLDNNENIKLVDCRELPEWEDARIKGAVFLPMSSFVNHYKEELQDKEQKIVVQCRSGGRSQQVANFLVSEGYQNVYNLSGGILDWIHRDFPIER